MSAAPSRTLRTTSGLTRSSRLTRTAWWRARNDAMSSGSCSASTDRLATTRTLPCAPVANSLNSACSRSMLPSNSCERRSNASPAAVGTMPRRPRTSSVVPTSCSSAAMRLLTAEATIASRAAARAMLRSSQTATNRRSVTGSRVRLIVRPRRQAGCRLWHAGSERRWFQNTAGAADWNV